MTLQSTILSDTRVYSTILQYLNKSNYLRISATCLKLNQAMSRHLLVRKPETQMILDQDHLDIDSSNEDQDADMTAHSVQTPGNIAEEKACRVCREALR